MNGPEGVQLLSHPMRKLGSMLFFALLFAGAPMAPAGAVPNTYDVTRTNDPNPGPCKPMDCSLREAVIASNSHPGPDVIRLDAGETYELTRTGRGEDNSKTGDLDIKGPVKIRSGESRATVDGNDIDGIFEILNPTADSKFIGLTIRDGRSLDSGSGGAVSTYANLTITNSVVKSNRAPDGTGGVVGDEKLVIRHSSILRNSGTWGGVASSDESPHDTYDLIMTNSVVANNKGSNGPAGIITGYGRLLIEDSVIRENKGYDGGVALYDTGTFRNVTITDNEATSGTGGLGVYGSSPEVTILNSRITRNTSEEAHGGINHQGTGERSLIRGSIISRNRGASGGGLYLWPQSELRIMKSTFSRNRTELYGGGIFSQESDLSVKKSTLTGNKSINVGRGGGMGILGGEVTISRSAFTGNSSVQGGGGLYIDQGEGAPPNVSIDNSTFANNSAAVWGGGISSAGNAATTLQGVTVARNEVTGGGGEGGGLWVSNGTFTVDNSLIALNRVALSGAGSDCYGTFVSDDNNLLSTIEDCSGFTQPGDVVDPHPRIRELADNGGPTKTVALRSGSPAIGEAGADAPNRDQRGRKRGAQKDIGAFERNTVQ